MAAQIIEAIYEGNGVVRLAGEPSGVKPNDRVTVLVLPIPTSKEFKVERLGADELSRQLLEFEQRYSLKTPDFYARFLRGELGDNRDYIVWAGLYEMWQRLNAQHQSAPANN